MRAVLDYVLRVAPSRLPVLLAGESGTGKEVVARVLHRASDRRGDLVAVNCAAIPLALAESELFGHVRGAFTGADAGRIGLFREADGGTLFLDEVGELEASIQAKLLRVLEDGVIRPVGAGSSHRVDVRVIAASHRDLARSSLRRDLYHRLAGVTLSLPPLRDRREDIPALVARFLPQYGGADRSLTVEAGEWLERHTWPGNVRELRQAIERALALGGDPLTVDDFAGPHFVRLPEVPVACDGQQPRWADVERAAIEDAIRRNGSVRAAARALGRPPSTVHDLVRRHGIAPNGRPRP